MSLIKDSEKEELLADEESVFHRILREKGVLSEYAVDGGKLSSF